MSFHPAATLSLLAAFPAVLLASQPAQGPAIAVPEPTDLLLFGMGLAGLVIGHRAATRRKDEGDDKD